ncbi:MAG: PorT family protein [Tannerella sp.]|jgi:hypothetical protein|nr:PorT family protein [Tannerella sp.]
MKTKLLLFAACLLYVDASFAQYHDGDLVFGINAGATYGSVANVPEILVSEDYYSGFILSDKDLWGAGAGIFVNYKYPGSCFAVQPEISYTQLNTRLNYSDVYDYLYDVNFKYSFVNIACLLKVYPVAGLNIGVGPQVGFNLTPNEILFSSNGEAQFGPNAVQEQNLRTVLKGKNDFSIGLTLGYEFKFGLGIDARYYFGLSDLVETQVNGYKFIENSNRSHSLWINVCWAFPFDNYFFK